jgi:hypothetical protein
LTLGEYGVVITSTPDRATLEDSQFEQAKALRELGIALPDDVLIENSRLQRRSEIVKQMQATKDTPEAQKRSALDLRAIEASVLKLEAEVEELRAKNRLSDARTQRELTDSQSEEQGEGDAENLKVQQELAIERERFELERREREEKLAFEREQFQLKLQFMREEQALKMETQRADAQRRQEEAQIRHYENRAKAVASPAGND